MFGWIANLLGWGGLSYWTVLKYVVPVVLVLLTIFGIWHYNKTWVNSYNKSFSTIASLRSEVNKLKQREVSYRRQIERYKAAAAASQCAAQIDKGVRNPDLIPKKWNPHEQLTAPNLRDQPHDNVDSFQPYDEYEWKKPSWWPW